MLSRSSWVRVLSGVMACLSLWMVTLPAYAADKYVTNYLKVIDPVSLELDHQGNSRLFSAEELASGKKVFEQSCLTCHVGGATLPNPKVPLSLKALQGAMPPRDTVASLVEFMRAPMLYDGSEESFECRKVPTSWLSQAEVESVAGFILRAAQKAPGWGDSLGQF
ncbi:photosystem II cytochrome PsbV2 [Phormidesmis sp. 146-33]